MSSTQYYKYSFPSCLSIADRLHKIQTFFASVDGTNGGTTPEEGYRPITCLNHSKQDGDQYRMRHISQHDG
jgi:hypothetical protein